MSETPEPNTPSVPAAEEIVLTPEELREENSRRMRLLLLVLLLLLMCCLCLFFAAKYLATPRPLPEIVPVANINYPPHYLYSIYKVDQPVSVALSPDSTRLYVVEAGGARKIKIFSRQGDLLSSFEPPHLSVGEKGMSYMAVNPSDGRVFVTDRTQGVIYIFAADGKYLDSILTPDLTLKGFIAQQVGADIPDNTRFFYSFLARKALYALPGQDEKLVDLNTGDKWAPIGVRFDQSGNLLVTDAYGDAHRIQKFAVNLIASPDYWKKWISSMVFGVRGSDKGQFLYPNTAVTDSSGRIYVSDGNNSRVSVWTGDGQYLNQFGNAGGDYGLNLPRGMWMDQKDRLYVVDTVGQFVKVFDVSGKEPVYLYSFGDYGVDDGLFNYPTDIVIDKAGWLFIADRENNRIQVWSY